MSGLYPKGGAEQEPKHETGDNVDCRECSCEVKTTYCAPCGGRCGVFRNVVYDVCRDCQQRRERLERELKAESERKYEAMEKHAGLQFPGRAVRY